MALTTCSITASVIAALDDLPNDVGGLTAAQLKAKFDEAGTNLKAYLNDTLIPELDTALAAKLTASVYTTHAALTASTAAIGHIRLATAAEVTTGTDDEKAVTPAGAKVELDKKLLIAGGTMSGILQLQNNTSYETGQGRNVFLSTGTASGGGNGDLWIVYLP